MRRLTKIIAAFICFLLLIAVALQGVTPVYDFAPPAPFSGQGWHNPYSGMDSAYFSKNFKKANLHAHESKEGAPYESMYDYSEGEFAKLYGDAGYDFALITDHQHINPSSPAPAYEHGMNVNNYHINVFGATDVWWFDIPVMLRPASQMQWQIGLLKDDGVLLSLNHPHRLRWGFEAEDISLLSGYGLIEVVVGATAPWDSVLSAGRYIMLSSTDDSHYPNNDIRDFQNRYTAVAASTPEGLWGALKAGRSYAVQHREPKTEVGKEDVPLLERVEVSGDTLFVEAHQEVDSIRYVGQGGEVKARGGSHYVLTQSDTYIRPEIYLSDGKILLLNPVARISDLEPVPEPQIDWVFTILNSLFMLVICAIIFIMIVRLLRHRRRPKRRRFKYRNRALNI